MERRSFIKKTVVTTFLPSLFNGFSLKAYSGSPLLAALANAENNDHVLVLVQLSGGNDGLNTVIPLEVYSNYFAARGNGLSIPERKVLLLNNYTKAGLHPAMTGMQQLFNDGKISIVRDVGYPSPNFSHFRATDIWLTGADSNEVLNTGWAGRYLNDEFPNFPVGFPNAQMPDPLAIQIGSVTSPAFQGPVVNMAMSITNPTNFYNLLDGVGDPVPSTPAGKELSYIREVAKQTNQFATSILHAANRVTQQAAYPSTSLAQQLKIVARLIAGGLSTKMYMVGMGGFDTHSQQAESTDPVKGNHANLLATLSDAINAFVNDLNGLKVGNRVLGMTFSEFGRRVLANGSNGTDHGTAAPVFIFGNMVQAGIVGGSPLLKAAPTVQDNLILQYDFRSVYGTLLENWFCLSNAQVGAVLLKNYQQLPIVNPVACGRATAVQESDRESGKNFISNYPNPFTEVTTISFLSRGGHTLVQVFDTVGRLIQVSLDKELTPGTYTVSFNGAHLPAGVYYARFQNGSITQVRTMMKVQ